MANGELTFLYWISNCISDMNNNKKYIYFFFVCSFHTYIFHFCWLWIWITVNMHDAYTHICRITAVKCTLTQLNLLPIWITIIMTEKNFEMNKRKKEKKWSDYIMRKAIRNNTECLWALIRRVALRVPTHIRDLTETYRTHTLTRTVDSCSVVIAINIWTAFILLFFVLIGNFPIINNLLDIF